MIKAERMLVSYLWAFRITLRNMYERRLYQDEEKRARPSNVYWSGCQREEIGEDKMEEKVPDANEGRLSPGATSDAGLSMQPGTWNSILCRTSNAGWSEATAAK
jgi:hypothetical protein